MFDVVVTGVFVIKTGMIISLYFANQMICPYDTHCIIFSFVFFTFLFFLHMTTKLNGYFVFLAYLLSLIDGTI